MYLITKWMIFSILSLCICLQGASAFQVEDIDSHLEKYPNYIQTSHDNIADSEHSHVHKHSENDEEHEHHHNHVSTQSSLVLFVHSTFYLNTVSNYESCHNFTLKSMNLSEFAFSIFRPPIV